MTAGWSTHGARCRGAVAMLEQFRAEGRKLWADSEGRLVIDPAKDLQPGDFHILRDLKPELMAWVNIPHHLWPIVEKLTPDPTLDELKGYQEALKHWDAFSDRERLHLLRTNPCLSDLKNIAALKEATGGRVVSQQEEHEAIEK